MKSIFLLSNIVLFIFCGNVFAETKEKEIFLDNFNSTAISSDWTVEEGKWTISNGALTNRGGGLIALNKPTGQNFILDAEIKMPANWVSVIFLYTSQEAYGTLYMGGGYFQFFDVDGKWGECQLTNIRSARLKKSIIGKISKLRIVCESGIISFFLNGKLIKQYKNLLNLRIGSSIAFRNQRKGGLLQIYNVRITKLHPKPVKQAYVVNINDYAKAAIYKDYLHSGKLSPSDSLVVDKSSKEAELTYKFSPDKVFEGIFARVPLNVSSCKSFGINVKGDGSKNTFFVILHDATGEQHMIVQSSMNLQGWSEVFVSLDNFLKSPDKMQRFYTRWGGDENQKIDFPIKAIDIGVAKRDGRKQDVGKIKFKNLFFGE